MSTNARPPRGPLCFVDARPNGGAFAALAAAVARAHGRVDALLAATSSAGSIPAEIAVVLDEIGAASVQVLPAGELPRDAQRVDTTSWELSLFEGEGDLERLSSARIARDRIERRVEALLATAG